MIKRDVLIILGGGINPATQEINKITQPRFNRAIEIEQNFKYILCIGDKTYKREISKGITTTEAQAGKNYLLNNSTINQNKIHLEEQSKDTFSNAFYAREYIEQQQLGTTITIITSEFHLKKARFLFEFVFNYHYELEFIEVENMFESEEELKRRQISEENVLAFYQTHLENVYHIKRGDLKSIHSFIEQINPATSKNVDKYHKQLTKNIEKEIGSIHTIH